GKRRSRGCPNDKAFPSRRRVLGRHCVSAPARSQSWRKATANGGRRFVPAESPAGEQPDSKAQALENDLRGTPGATAPEQQRQRLAELHLLEPRHEWKPVDNRLEDLQHSGSRRHASVSRARGKELGVPLAQLLVERLVP